MNPIENLKFAKEALSKALAQKKQNEELIKSIGPAIVDMLMPFLEEMSNNAKMSRQDMLDCISQIKIDVPPTNVPEAKVAVTLPDFPKIEIPTPQVTVNQTIDTKGIEDAIKKGLANFKIPEPKVTVNVPPVNVPELPEQIPFDGNVHLVDVDKKNPLPVVLMDANGKPFQMSQSGGIGGGPSPQTFFTDPTGRQIITPMQMRSMRSTAYVSISTGTETTLLAGKAGEYLDMIQVIGTNNSDAAVSVDIRDATGAGIITTLRIPANGTAGASNTSPIPQNMKADTWTADMPDITGTIVTLSALFSREI